MSEQVSNYIVDGDKGWTEKECYKCSGEGRLLCKECGGDGMVFKILCEDCAGQGMVDCDNCDGSGKILEPRK